MYELINLHVGAILAEIAKDRKHVPGYDRLCREIGDVNTEPYQKLYRHYWAMNRANLSDKYYKAYFKCLSDKKAWTLDTLLNELCRESGDQSLQVSFATKLLHMIDHRLPIYDSRVAKFYCFKRPTTKSEGCIKRFEEFYNDLKGKYKAILDKENLTTSIDAFRKQFNPTEFTDEKIIDSLIWGFVAFVDYKGGLPKTL